MKRQQKLARLHTAFVRANLARSPFRPDGRSQDSDYNLHHVDLEAPDAARDRFLTQASAIFKD